MKPFIGRKEELSFLQQKYNSNQSEFLVFYGRRRIGKTETLVHFCRDKNPVFFTCTQTEDFVQLRNFSRRVLSFPIPQAQYISEFPSWEQAFLALKDFPKEKGRKQILVIDEFPYMVKGNPEIPSILQKLWDMELRKANIMIILCGSSMSYMEKEILSEKNPLYGRATGIFRMLPMPFSDVEQFFPGWSGRDKVLAYSLLGGIPFYLCQFDDAASLEKNICSYILGRGSILYSEPEFLLRQELREPITYNTIIQSIAFGRTAFNEIQQSTMIEKGKLSVYLKNLLELGILSREFPALSTEKEKQNAQRGVYRIRDSFFRFWYRFVYPNVSTLEFGDYENIFSSVIEPQLNDFASMAFEDVCMEWLRFRNRQHQLPFVFTQIGRWWDRNIEVDAIACNAERSEFISVECKFHNGPVNDSDIRRHLEKDLSSLKRKNDSKIHFWYFSWGGFTDEANRYAREKGVVLVEGKDMLPLHEDVKGDNDCL